MRERSIIPGTDENPIWTEEMFARARRGRDVVPAEVLTAAQRYRDEQKASRRRRSVPLDADVVDHYKQSGRGWQDRVNDILRSAAGLPIAR